jgi:hypothetical protein
MRLLRSNHLAAAAVFLFFLCVFLLSGSSDLRHNGDTDLRYQTTQSMVEFHRLWIADPIAHDTRVARGVGGHLYAFYAPGQSIFMVPLYIGGKIIAHHLSLPYDITTLYACRSLDLILGATLATIFFLTALSLGYSRRIAILLTLLFGLATAVWPDAQSALEQTQVNLFLLGAVLGLVRFQASGQRRWLYLAGTSLGLAVFTRYDMAIFFPIFGLYVMWLSIRGQAVARLFGDWVSLGAGLAPWVLAVLVWDTLRFGKPWLTGLHQATFGEPFTSGLTSLTISPGKGIIWYVPLMLLLPWAAPRFARGRSDLMLLFAALMVVPLAFYANVLYWHGDPAWGPRYLFVAIPYAILPLGALLERWRGLGRSARGAVIALIGFSLFLNVAAVSVTQWRFWYHLEAAEEHTDNPFRWGAQYYHYYWTPSLSPIYLQPRDFYEIVRLAMGDRHYLLSASPTVCTPGRCVSNPVLAYPINSAAFWWADTRHSLLGDHTRDALAIALALGAAWWGFVLMVSVRARDDEGTGAVLNAGALQTRVAGN